MPAPAAGEPEAAPAEEAVEPATDGAIRVEAPMVGTFYRAAQPGAPPFVEEGDAVAPGQTLCILEAMKLMNEVKAEVEGVVRTIHVQNGQPVEYGQALFDLEPALARPLDALYTPRPDREPRRGRRPRDPRPPRARDRSRRRLLDGRRGRARTRGSPIEPVCIGAAPPARATSGSRP